MSSNQKIEQILVVDDAPDTRELVKRHLLSTGYNVFTASNVPEAINILDTIHVDLVITDLKMPEISGLDLVRHVRDNFRNTEVMVITGYPSIGSAVEAVKIGADDYLVKPFTDDELFRAVEKALDKLHVRLASISETENDSGETYGLIGESDVIHELRRNIEKTAQTSVTTLISGESGTGKELVARAIHYNSSRSSAAFVPVNCGGIPEGLLESELFGHIKGAFTGATESRAGFVQVADGGSMFLDEISETSLAMQVKLLRLLQEKEICMVGVSRPRNVDVRIIASTNKELTELIKKGTFREDLYFRLNIISILIPPLRERGDDILLLARYFMKKYANEFGKPLPDLSDNALKALKQYHWPGNVRELENIIQRLVVMMEDDIINVVDLPPIMHFSALNSGGFDRTLAQVEAEYIRNVLQTVDGNKTHAAQILGIDRKTLREKIKRYSIES